MQADSSLLDVVSEFDFKELLAAEDEIQKRKIEALKLYRPLSFQEEYHSCLSKECVLQKGNQVGGSLCGFVEVARAVTAQDPYKKYPKRDGIVVCLGYGEKHIGRVIHKYLFRAGAFRIVRDIVTGEWRVFHPWSAKKEINGFYGDAGREHESKPVPPLIPNRFIEGKIAWTKRSENIFSYVKFTTGWELYALNSAGDPSQAQGFQVNLYHIDEDVATPGWCEEATGRTMIPKGLIRWTAIPHAKTDDIMNMIHRAQEEEENGVDIKKRITVRVKATIYDNPFIPEESRKANERIWRNQGEDVFRKRALGDVVLDMLQMYPTFNRRVHEAISHEKERHQVQKIITENLGEPPNDWTRYMVVDPGHTVCAVLFLAVPPIHLGDIRVAYDEVYIRNADKYSFVRHITPRMEGKTFQDFIIDAHGGRLREIGSGILPKRQYENEMEKARIECVARGSRFLPGSDDIHGREEKVRDWLALRDNGYPKLMIIGKKCSNLVRELDRFRKKTVRIGGQDIPTDDGNRRANTHCVEALEYAAANGLPYVKPKSTSKSLTAVAWIKKQREQRAKQRAVRELGPNTGSRSLGPRGVPA